MGRPEEMIRKQDEMIRKSDAIKAINLIQNVLFNIDILPVTPQTRERHDVIQAILRDVWKVKEKLEKLPAVQPEPPWIPCSKKLPQYREDVLISFLEGFVISASREKWEMSRDVWMTDDGVTLNLNDANAWMPMPEPYEGE